MKEDTVMNDDTPAPATWHASSDGDAISDAPANPKKKPYTAPTLVRWGTLQDITQTTGWRGAGDGGKGFYRKTRW